MILMNRNVRSGFRILVNCLFFQSCVSVSNHVFKIEIFEHAAFPVVIIAMMVIGNVLFRRYIILPLYWVVIAAIRRCIFS